MLINKMNYKNSNNLNTNTRKFASFFALFFIVAELFLLGMNLNSPNF